MSAICDTCSIFLSRSCVESLQKSTADYRVFCFFCFFPCSVANEISDANWLKEFYSSTSWYFLTQSDFIGFFVSSGSSKAACDNNSFFGNLVCIIHLCRTKVFAITSKKVSSIVFRHILCFVRWSWTDFAETDWLCIGSWSMRCQSSILCVHTQKTKHVSCSQRYGTHLCSTTS